MKENYFTFRGEHYKQLTGAPIGNPFSGKELEKKLVSVGQIERYWKRYLEVI